MEVGGSPMMGEEAKSAEDKNGVQGSVQQSRLSSHFALQCCNLPQLLTTQLNLQFHLNLHFNLQF